MSKLLIIPIGGSSSSVGTTTTLTFSDLWGDQLDQELGSIDRDQRFTVARRKMALNEAQTEFIERTECLVQWFSAAVTDGVGEADLEAAITNYLRLAKAGPSLKMVDGSGNERYAEGPDDFPQTDPPLLNRLTPGWRGTTGATPSRWYLRRNAGALNFGLTPPPSVPAGETWTLLLPCVVRAVDMSADTDLPFTVYGGVAPASLAIWSKALVHHAAFLLEKLRKDPTRMKIQAELFESYVARYLRQDKPKGGQTVQLAHDYRRSGRSRGPRRFSVNAATVSD
jgi:hypothetical protein